MNELGRWSRILLLALSGLGVACVPRVQEPTVELIGARVGSIGFQGGLVYVRVSVENPNRFTLEASGIDYEISFRDPDAPDAAEWVSFAAGRLDEGLRVEAGETAVVEVPVEFRFRDMGALGRSVFGTGSIDYHLTGTVSVVRPVRREVPYQRTGVFSLGGEGDLKDDFEDF